MRKQVPAWSELQATSHTRPLRIGLLGQFGIGNLGNEGSLEAMLLFIQTHAPAAKLVCICSDPKLVRGAHNIDAIPIRGSTKGDWLARLLNRALLGVPRRFEEIVQAMTCAASLDVLIIPGTGILDDFRESPFGLPYDLWRWCVAAKLGGAKIAFVSVGAGPILNRLSLWFMKNAARCAHYRSYRDEPSRTFAERRRMGGPEDRIFPDLTFHLPPPSAASRPPRADLTIAVGVMAYCGWNDAPDRRAYEDYEHKLGEYVAWLIETGRRVKFVIGSDKDVDVVEGVRRRVLNRLPSGAHGMDPFVPAHSLHDVMHQMDDADIVVATRFHNVVCALRAGRPTISLGYAAKNRALLATMGLEAFSQDVDGFDLERLKAQTEQIIGERAAHETAIRRQVLDCQAQLLAQDQLLAVELLEAPRGAGRVATS